MSTKKKQSGGGKNQTSTVNYALTNPFRLNWPVIEENIIQDAIKLLVSSFTDVSLFNNKLTRGDRLKSRTANKKSVKENRESASKDKICGKRPSGDDASNRAMKIMKLQPEHQSKDIIELNEGIPSVVEEVKNCPDAAANGGSEQVTEHSNKKDISLKKSQFVLGCNSLTRCLEQNTLRCGMVCQSARPTFVTQHIVMLSGIRNCPIMPLPSLSKDLASLLGIKSAMAVGFKNIPLECVDHFSDITSFIIANTPSLSSPFVRLPAATIDMKETQDEATSSSYYLPLKMKTMSKPIQQ